MVGATPECPVSFDGLRDVLDGAAGLLRSAYANGVRVERKPDGSPVTRADLAADAYLRAALHDLLPCGWLSEETADDRERLRRDWVWVVDPIDGTKEFSRRIPEFAVSVGLVHEHTVVLGGVVNPATGEGGIGRVDGHTEFWGFGSRPRRSASFEDAVVSVSRSEVEDGSIVPYLRVVPGASSVGSVAYKLLRVAAGADDMTFSMQHKNEWDVCGGAALIAAAGKTYRRFDGERFRFNQRDTRIRSGSVAGPDDLVERFLAVLARSPMTAGTSR